MRVAAQTSRADVMKVDKAMQTCSRYAKTGYKCNRVKLSNEERSGYKGVADGIYECIRKHSR